MSSFGGFSFGAPAQQQQQPAQATTGLFGAVASNPSSNNTNTNPPSTGLFGSTTTNANNSNPTGSTSTFSGFGNTAADNGAGQAKPAFGGFGTTTTQPSSLFGAPTNQSSTPSLFGQQPQQQQQQQPSTSGLFGGAGSQATATGGLFGSSVNNLGGTTGGNGGLFGGGFGQQQQQQQQQQQPQQQQQQNTLTVSQLGNPNGQLGSSTFIPGPYGANGGIGAGLRAPLRVEDVPIEQRIEYIKASWDPSSPYCRFKYFFYNVVPENEVGLYARPENVDDAMWFKAQRDNPEPSTMVPTLAVGFSDLGKRVDAQMKMAGAHWGKLQEISTRLSTLSKTSHLSLSLRVSRSHLLQTQLSHRTLLLIRHLHLLIPTLRSSSIRREEEALTERLSVLVRELEGGRGAGSDGNVKGRLMELWGLLGQVKTERERDRQGRGSDGGHGLEGWAVVDDEAMERLAKIIADQQTALQHLTKILREDLAAIEIMRQGFGLAGKETGQR
ncbi:Nuclear pore complex, p54 component (sc Nup57) [Phaffia rhodozyma]|uniref:Nuclear pore complex, p54 component (Sc Nup57) n=1 Tax=Phaffia rhodozyma TaxID=264483 RepID=A0A0F7ST68_PHARH|nr:Nuclear pore complex, p54 component (sc Nup57) [Phaffia rhodozyma]